MDVLDRTEQDDRLVSVRVTSAPARGRRERCREVRDRARLSSSWGSSSWASASPSASCGRPAVRGADVLRRRRRLLRGLASRAAVQGAVKVFVGQPLVEPSTTDLLAAHEVVTGGGQPPALRVAASRRCRRAPADAARADHGRGPRRRAARAARREPLGGRRSRRPRRVPRARDPRDEHAGRPHGRDRGSRVGAHPRGGAADPRRRGARALGDVGRLEAAGAPRRLARGPDARDLRHGPHRPGRRAARARRSG